MEKEKWLVRVMDNCYIARGTEEEAIAFVENIVKHRVAKLQKEEGSCYRGDGPEKTLVNDHWLHALCGPQYVLASCVVGYEDEFEEEESYFEARAIRLDTFLGATFDEVAMMEGIAMESKN